MKTMNLSFPLNEEVLKEISVPQVLAMGQFDGLHLGHVSVIESAVKLSREQGLQSAVLTFHPHPKEVMRKGDYQGYLTPLREKEEILEKMNVDVLYVLEFNESFSNLLPEQFVDQFLLPSEVKVAVVGFDFRFGHKGAGDEKKLRELGLPHMNVVTIPPLMLDDEKVSSTSIRSALYQGNVKDAERMLGRPYSFRGIVIDGEKRGRTIGFPTANVEPSENYVVPIKGVYAVWVTHLDKKYPGVMNIGVKPTFHKDRTKPSFEVHLLDYNGDLYGEELTVELVEFLRPEQRFPSIDELIAQIRKDSETAKQILANLS
ncbi:bifunctional riboflavin kinase/FAD synthetase [Paenibacillus sp. Marseille-Q4541]|uniref:bifunctional riboflavin kinase/FAD synthetase n=1 Tax=Paenibacillus sp. Marseille-Q4541 TaxID=2831522 RepID=UPI001BA51E93|nr:bifunctional riboflavin kinase/FAD synthetase [Paenibacillus sp. Marseille-Q4541]